MYKKFEIKIILSNFTGQNRKIKTTIDMEIKKTEKANLENKKLLFTEIGLIISLLIVFIAFEWTQAEVKVSNLEDTTEVVTEEEIIPITQETPPPPPSAPKIPILSLSIYGNEPKYLAASIWSSVSYFPNSIYVHFLNFSPFIPVPRPSTHATT